MGMAAMGLVVCLALVMMMVAVVAALAGAPAAASEQEMRFLRAAGDGDLATMEHMLNSGQAYTDRYGETRPATGLVHAQGPILRQPLHFAALQNRAMAVRFLTDSGALVDARERFGVTPLHYACMLGHLDAAAALVQKGANVDAQNHNHWTPLHYAARHGRLDAVRFLVAHGARLDLVNRQERLTPMGLAERFGMGAAAALLRELASEDGGRRAPQRAAG
jgi:hypothetical protein